MAVDLAAGEQPGERELLEHRRAFVVVGLLAQDRVGERRRDDEPARPQRRGERLADRAEVDDAVRRQALQRADGCAVVAILGVVVVLEDQPVPFEQPCAARRAEHDPGRELVRGRDRARRARRCAASAATSRPSSSTGTATGSSPAGGELRLDRLRCRVLQRDPRDAPLQQRAGDERESLRDAGRDHGRGRVGDHAAHPPEIGRELRPQLHRPLRVRVAEPIVGAVSIACAAAFAHVWRGNSAASGVPGRRSNRGGRAGSARGPDRLGGRGALLAHARRRPAPRHEVALGGELRVRVAHHAAGHGQLVRQHPGGRQRACPAAAARIAPPRAVRVRAADAGDVGDARSRRTSSSMSKVAFISGQELALASAPLGPYRAEHAVHDHAARLCRRRDRADRDPRAEPRLHRHPHGVAGAPRRVRVGARRGRGDAGAHRRGHRRAVRGDRPLADGVRGGQVPRRRLPAVPRRAHAAAPRVERRGRPSSPPNRSRGRSGRACWSTS